MKTGSFFIIIKVMGWQTFLKYLRPSELRFYLNLAVMLPYVYMLVKAKKNFGDNYVLKYIENGDLKKLSKFIIKNKGRNINKYYYRMLGATVYERHTLLTAAVYYNKPDIVRFMLEFPKIDLNLEYVFSASSFNHRQQTALQMAEYFNYKEIIRLLERR